MKFGTICSVLSPFSIMAVLWVGVRVVMVLNNYIYAQE